MSSNQRDKSGGVELPLASPPAPPGLPLSVVTRIDLIMGEMKSILEENPDHNIRKYTVDTLNDATMMCVRDVYNHHNYPLPSWMIRTQEQTPKDTKHESDDDKDGDCEDSEKKTPTGKSKRRASFPPAKRSGGKRSGNKLSGPKEKLPARLSARKAKLEKARLKKQRDEGSTQPEDYVVKLLIPITTVRSLDKEQERLIALYFTLSNFTKVIRKNNSYKRYTLSSDHAIEIVNFFFGQVFASLGAKMVDTIVKECSKSTTWKSFDSLKAYSGDPATYTSVCQIHIVHQAEFMTEITQKTRLRALRTLELGIEFFEAYDGCCQLLQRDDPDADLIAYMGKEGFGPAVGVTMKSRFYSMMAKQLKIDSKTLLKKVLGGFFLYHLVSSFSLGVLALLQDNALRFKVVKAFQ